VITIDPDDAKDFDDAISLTHQDNLWRLGVHIADVSQFVGPNTTLDREAHKRGNSAYFPNHVAGPNIDIDYSNPLVPVISSTNTNIEEILDKTFKYTGDFLTGVEFSNGAFKVLNYLSNGQLDTLLFANNGFNILKQFNYDNLGRLTSITETQV